MKYVLGLVLVVGCGSVTQQSMLVASGGHGGETSPGGAGGEASAGAGGSAGMDPGGTGGEAVADMDAGADANTTEVTPETAPRDVSGDWTFIFTARAHGDMVLTTGGMFTGTYTFLSYKPAATGPAIYNGGGAIDGTFDGTTITVNWYGPISATGTVAISADINNRQTGTVMLPDGPVELIIIH